MKDTILKYALEFIVIIAGILVSFYIEKQNAISYKDELKNQSLGRLISNIENDIIDSKWNYNIHSKGAKFGKIILNRSDELFNNDKDSLGYYLKSVSLFGTNFVDNQEEYNTLRNSGLMELIDNDSLVSKLQFKYSYHSHFKRLEAWISRFTELDKTANQKISSKTIGKTLYGPHGTYISNEPLNHYELNVLARKTGLFSYYAGKIKKSIISDSLLIIDIREEIERHK